jgi:hypothetical protein
MIGTIDGFAIDPPMRFEGRDLARRDLARRDLARRDLARLRRSLRRSDGLPLSLAVEFGMFVIVPLERAITMGGGIWRPSFEMHCLLWCWG